MSEAVIAVCVMMRSSATTEGTAMIADRGTGRGEITCHATVSEPRTRAARNVTMKIAPYQRLTRPDSSTAGSRKTRVTSSAATRPVRNARSVNCPHSSIQTATSHSRNGS